MNREGAKSAKKDTNLCIAAIILAAGGAARYGQPKQLLPWRGRTVIEQVVEAVLASPVAQAVLVTGAYAEAIQARLESCGEATRLIVAHNPDWREGLSSSLRAGLARLDPATTAALFVMGDQPNLTAELIEQLIAAREQTGARIVAPAARGQRGHPILFDHTLFPELLAVQGDQGGRQVVARHRDELVTVEVDAALLLDIDTPEDYQRASKT